MDEVGRGCLAGPVVAAAVILDPRRPVEGLDDSKRLSPRRREALDLLIRERAVAWAIGQVEADEIDRINILQATRRASVQAVRALPVRPASLLLDALRLPDLNLPQRPIVHGDRVSVSIAAASIIAKVFRDALMARAGEDWPGYGFAGHKGYGSPEHLEALSRLGPCPLHRRTFRGVLPGAPRPPEDGRGKTRYKH